MSSKLTQLKEFSNPEFVSWKAQQMGLNPVYESSRKDKKYMVFDGHKMIHFGQMFATDYTKHLDDKRRINFRKRNWNTRHNIAHQTYHLSFYGD